MVIDSGNNSSDMNNDDEDDDVVDNKDRILKKAEVLGKLCRITAVAVTAIEDEEGEDDTKDDDVTIML